MLVPRRPSLTAWTVISGKLPPGLEITPEGFLRGTPTLPGKYTFTVMARDGSGAFEAPATVINITENIAIAWKQVPHVDGDAAAGSVEVTSYLSKPADLTVIVVAVNAIGKAFALAYQQYTLVPDSRGKVIPFAAALPFGGYIIHADAVAEIPDTKVIYRSRLQTETRLVFVQH